jgi:hypothetical protein
MGGYLVFSKAAGYRAVFLPTSALVRTFSSPRRLTMSGQTIGAIMPNRLPGPETVREWCGSVMGNIVSRIDILVVHALKGSTPVCWKQ